MATVKMWSLTKRNHNYKMPQSPIGNELNRVGGWEAGMMTLCLTILH